MLKLLRNPMYIYILGFSITFLVYALDWSGIYPPISFEIKIFFSITFLGFILFGFAVDCLKLINKTFSKTKTILISRCFYFLLIFYGLEFLAENDIPLISKILGRQGVRYTEFGIPVLHGVLISFNSFLIAHSFATYMATKNKKILIYYLLLYVPPLLFISRSIMVIGLLTSFFIFLHFIEKIKFWTWVKLTGIILFCLYFFGVVGNLRSGGAYIYQESLASDDFMESSIPKEYYWTYLYAAAPLANFQNTVDKKKVYDYSFKGFIFHENLPQIISKKFGPLFGIEERDLVRIVPWLTVGTAYAKSYSYLEWFGPYLLFIFNIIFYLFIILVGVPKTSNYHITTISILSVIILMNIFGNILVVTGIIFQLAYCILFAFLEGKKFVLRI
ncbi:MAG TPA: oligosaccharide repeat unit polymerase [Pricia antarctica]|uniref:Oligosaccharide repeat unit polymerase n=3 Tax=root TaxID=1 RepID=A0A831QKR5_9FLAO|nr:oligosaccharide repeat unit polymerase [Pricia antarctica]